MEGTTRDRAAVAAIVGALAVALALCLAGCAQAHLGPAPDAGDDGGGGSSSCGDGRVDAGEECDDGNNDDADACTASCTTARCGDGVVQLGVEACDDGNDVDTDTCTSACTGWQYRTPVHFEAPAAGTDHTIVIVLDTTSFGYAHAAADGSDLRFATSETPASFDIPYWIETWAADGKSYVWVRVPTVTAGANTIYAFHGHSASVTSASDFATTFPNTLRTTASTTLGGAVTYDALIIEAPHTITVTPGAPLAITARYVQIVGTIDANGAGYAAASGPGAGGGSTNAGAGGGGHGSTGGVGGLDVGDTPGAAGAANGDLASETIDMGSGGGSTDTSVGARGGGAVHIDAERIVVTGAITARGAAGAGSGRSSGGGAGGGVMLRAPSLSFTGSIVVVGGNGGSGSDLANDGGGGGSGGRIKLFHTGDVVDTGSVTLGGGAGGQYGDQAKGGPGNAGTKHTGTSATLGALPTLGTEQHL